MIWHILFSVLAVAIAAVAAPLFLDLALCLAGNLRRVRRRPAEDGKTIHLAVVIPAHDEEHWIARAVGSVRKAESSTPIYVVAHNCADRTAIVAANAGALVLELNDRSLTGKGAALRHGFQEALKQGANAVLVIDADSVVSANLSAATRAALEEGAGATQCRYELEIAAAAPDRTMAELRALAFRGINVLRARGRASLGFSAGIFGNGFALAADTLERVPFGADSIAEDLEYHTRLVSQGIRVHWIEDAYVHAPVSAPGSAQAAQEARWEGGKLSLFLHSTSRLIPAILHGNWRALETLAESLSLPLSRGILALIVAALLPVHWLHLYAAVCAMITLLYVLGAALLGKHPARDLAALAAAPLYMLWKLSISLSVLRHSRGNAAWVRTKREAPQP